MQWQDHHGKLTNQIQVPIWLERQQQLWQQHLLLGCSPNFEGSQVKNERDECSWKGQLERMRGWKVLSWKV